MLMPGLPATVFRSFCFAGPWEPLPLLLDFPSPGGCKGGGQGQGYRPLGASQSHFVSPPHNPWCPLGYLLIGGQMALFLPLFLKVCAALLPRCHHFPEEA
jgi:hypothetical protein